jgi:hypothetical protein
MRTRPTAAEGTRAAVLLGETSDNGTKIRSLLPHETTVETYRDERACPYP